MLPHDLERLIRRDPAARGLLAAAGAEGFCVGHLADAAADLAQHARCVGIVTGFFVPDADPPAAETDGLAGSLLLADILRATGVDAFLITDEPCAAAVRAAAAVLGVRFEVDVCPLEPDAASRWRERLRASRNSSLTHLIAVERVGPGYTPEALRERMGGDSSTMEEFLASVPPVSRGRCHNMRGRDIHCSTGELHLLFEPARAGIRTIGIGDGGNEIGMGNILWPRLRDAIRSDHAGRVASRIATTWTILAGVSDWGAFALAAAVALEREAASLLQDWTSDRLEQILQAAVANGPAIDGITRRSEPTVDGLPFITWVQPWLHIRRELGL